MKVEKLREMNDAELDKKSTAAATSSGVPIRPATPRPTSASRSSGNDFIGAVIGVSITPGATALTRIPSPAQCTARFRVSASSAALAAE